MKNNNMTPKQAAAILLNAWYSKVCHYPETMDIKEMNNHLKDYEYNVTQNRYDQILNHIKKFMAYSKEKVNSHLIGNGYDIVEN